MKTILVKKESWYNPYFLNGKEVEKVNVYNKNGVVFGFKWIGSNNITNDVTFDFETKKAIKLNFNRKDSFYIQKDGKITIYIYHELINYKYIGREKKYETEMGYSLYDIFSITLNCKKILYKKVNDDFVSYYSEQGDFDFEIESFVESIDSSFAKECMQISKKCEEAGVKLSYYDIGRLKKIINISLK